MVIVSLQKKSTGLFVCFLNKKILMKVMLVNFQNTEFEFTNSSGLIVILKKRNFLKIRKKFPV